MHKKLAFATLCLCLMPLFCAAQSAEAVTAIRAGKFVDVEAGRVLADQIILIRGKKIEAVGSKLAIPAGAAVIDLSNMTVLPGLVAEQFTVVVPSGKNEPERGEHVTVVPLVTLGIGVV